MEKKVPSILSMRKKSIRGEMLARPFWQLRSGKMARLTNMPSLQIDWQSINTSTTSCCLKHRVTQLHASYWLLTVDPFGQQAERLCHHLHFLLILSLTSLSFGYWRLGGMPSYLFFCGNLCLKHLPKVCVLGNCADSESWGWVTRRAKRPSIGLTSKLLGLALSVKCGIICSFSTYLS